MTDIPFRHVGPAAMALRPLMTIAVRCAPPAPIGDFPLGERRLSTFTGGTFAGVEGSGLAGVVEPGGADWQTVRGDGTVELRAHYLLRTDRGEAIEVQSDGIRIMSPAVVARFAAGEAVGVDEYYFRTHVRLSTGSPRLGHLNERIHVSTGERLPDVVHIHVHEVQ